jgi:hypothetical protein
LTILCKSEEDTLVTDGTMDQLVMLYIQIREKDGISVLINILILLMTILYRTTFNYENVTCPIPGDSFRNIIAKKMLENVKNHLLLYRNIDKNINRTKMSIEKDYNAWLNGQLLL